MDERRTARHDDASRREKLRAAQKRYWADPNVKAARIAAMKRAAEATANGEGVLGGIEFGDSQDRHRIKYPSAAAIEAVFGKVHFDDDPKAGTPERRWSGQPGGVERTLGGVSAAWAVRR